MSRIRLSEKHGLNPSISLCHICGEPNGGIVLPGKINLPASHPDGPQLDAAAPRQDVWDYEPCDTCKAHMQTGVILIEVREDTPTPSPNRTGRLLVVKDAALMQLVQPESLAAEIIRARRAFVPVEAMEKILKIARDEGALP